MAKKSSFSFVETEAALKSLVGRQLRDTLGYELLRIFCGYGEASIQRLVDGRGNDAKDGCTLLVKKKLAYRPVLSGDLTEALNALTSDPAIVKKEPRLYVVCDGTNVLGWDPKEDDIYSNTVDLLWRDFEFFKPLAGIEKVQYAEEAEADVKSAEMMARIYDDIRRYNDVHDERQIHALNLFMSRLLFCYFAEDTGLFPEVNLFTNALKTCTKNDGSDLAQFIGQLFEAMFTPDNSEQRSRMPDVVRRFPYVNGGLFREQTPIPVLSFRTRLLMLKCGEYDWKRINPDIFGSMIQAVVAPEMRAGLGIHYTSVTNIQKVIRPLFLDALVDEYTKSKDNPKRLNQLLVRLSKIKFFDPACGSGNFLIISYKSIRALEIRIWDRLRILSKQHIMPFSNIKLTQFYGIEIDEYACDTARLSLWLAEHQMNNMFYEAFGSRPNPLPLHQSGNIVCGNACRIDWSAVCPHTADEEVYVMGNPPYLGYTQQDEEQKQDLKIAWKDYNDAQNIDYISAWFIKASEYIGQTPTKAAFVSTNSICQGESASAMWTPIFRLGLEIFFAYRSFKWKNNAKNNAGVTCTIVGVANKNNITKRSIYDATSCIEVSYINAYLLNAPNVIVEKASKSLFGLQEMTKGSMPADGGNLILSPNEKDDLVAAYPQSSILIKQFVGSQEFIRDEARYCLWIRDGDLDLAASIPPIRQRAERVYQMRMESKKETTNKDAQRPYQFSEVRYIEGTNAIIVPSVSSERREYIPIGYVGADTVISNLAFAVYDAELWLFAVLTSKMHNIWVRAVGGRLKTDYRYSATLCYNTFPFPKISAEQKDELKALAREVLGARAEHTEMTLGEMYNPETMPVDLRLAHQALDASIERCYRPEPFTSDEERLEYLFKLYERMTKKK